MIEIGNIILIGICRIFLTVIGYYFCVRIIIGVLKGNDWI
jgi:hypothetical protein